MGDWSEPDYRVGFKEKWRRRAESFRAWRRGKKGSSRSDPEKHVSPDPSLGSENPAEDEKKTCTSPALLCSSTGDPPAAWESSNPHEIELDSPFPLDLPMTSIAHHVPEEPHSCTGGFDRNHPTTKAPSNVKKFGSSHGFFGTLWAILGVIVSPVVISVFLALVIALVSPLKALFVEDVEGWSGSRVPNAPNGKPILAFVQEVCR